MYYPSMSMTNLISAGSIIDRVGFYIICIRHTLILLRQSNAILPVAPDVARMRFLA